MSFWERKALTLLSLPLTVAQESVCYACVFRLFCYELVVHRSSLRLKHCICVYQYQRNTRNSRMATVESAESVQSSHHKHKYAHAVCNNLRTVPQNPATSWYSFSSSSLCQAWLPFDMSFCKESCFTESGTASCAPWASDRSRSGSIACPVCCHTRSCPASHTK